MSDFDLAAINGFDLMANRLVSGGAREIFVNVWQEKNGCPVFIGRPCATRGGANLCAGFEAASSYRLAYRLRIIPKRPVQP